jgi:hypothetical protein
MTNATHVPIALKCHPAQACPAVRGLAVSVRVLASGRLWMSYALDADLEQLRIPAEDAPRRAHELWTHTCFEAFVGESREPGYCELNVAPSKAWALYRFSAPRVGMAVVKDAPAPRIAIRRTPEGLTLEAMVYWRDLITASAPERLRLGLAAVLEDDGGRLSYWALRHPPGRPNFHHPDSFTLELDL